MLTTTIIIEDIDGVTGVKLVTDKATASPLELLLGMALTHVIHAKLDELMSELGNGEKASVASADQLDIIAPAMAARVAANARHKRKGS